MRKSRSDYAFIAAICAAAHSRKVTCARPFNVLKFLGLRLSCFRALTHVLFSLFVPSALRGVQHVTICTFQFCKSFVSDLLSSSSWNVVPGFGSEKLVWFGVRGEWPPQFRLHLVRLYVAVFNLTVESECVFKTSSNWVLHLSSCIWEELVAVALDRISRSVSRFCNSKNELKSGFPAPKCGPKNGPVFWAFGTCANTRWLQKGARIPGPFLVPLFTLSERRFSQKMVASRCCCDGHNLSQFLSCFLQPTWQPELLQD